MGIVVQRTPYDKPGPDIVDPLLTTADGQLERGRFEINKSADRLLINGELVDFDHIDPGSLAHVKSKGVDKKGLLVYFSFSATIQEDNLQASTSVEIEALK